MRSSASSTPKARAGFWRRSLYDGTRETEGDREARLWIESILNDIEPRVLPEQAAVVTEILEAIYVSAREGKPVYFKDGRYIAE